MECGKLTAKLRDAVPVCFIENGKEVKRFKNIEIPDEIKKLPYQDFEFSVPVTGAITFKIMFEEGVLPKNWPEARTRKTRKAKPEEVLMHERITANEPENMEEAFNVTGERRKMLVEAIKAFVNAPAVYQNAPSFAYVIGDYTVSKSGTVSGPVNEALMAALNANGFIVD